MARSLQTHGQLVLPQLSFAGELLDASGQNTLAQLATLLKEKPTMELLIVVHVAKGKSMEADLELSARRAQQLIDGLTGIHGIAASRLSGRGVGSLAPLANTRPDDRQNERIVIMVQ
jgi:outer membrane protein OmpA-like peptidoglycan-associated protein